MRLSPRLIVLAGLVVAALSTLAAGAQPASPPADASPEAAIGSLDASFQRPPPEALAVPLDPEKATEAYLAKIPPDKRARSDAYFEGGYWLILWDFLYGLAVAWVLLGTGLSAKVRDLVERISRFRPIQTFLYVVFYIVAVSVLSFPMTVYEGFFREHQYGMANQTFGPWLRDQAVGLAVGLVLGGVALTAIYGVVRKAPRTWWVWGSIVAIVFLMFTILIGPVYIDPLFNKYTSLEDARVKDPILSMARANGIPAHDVFVFNASKQTKRVSANVSGFANTMSVRLNDNLLKRSSLPAIEAVMGHEMGHYVLNHVYKGILYFGVVIVIGFSFLRWSFEWARARWGARWRIRDIGDVAGLPLLAALLSVFFFVLTPINNSYVRSNEAEADIFGLNASRQPDGFAEAALQLGEYRKMSPGPIEEWIFYDHPSGRHRISMAMHWKAEQVNKPAASAQPATTQETEPLPAASAPEPAP